MMREIGVSVDECKEHCSSKEQREGKSGCSPSVNGYEFKLCDPCKREGCKKWPSVEECEIGCDSYGK